MKNSRYTQLFPELDLFFQATEPGEVVYLLHLTRPLSHAQHYIGYTKDFERRLKEHLSGNNGSPLINAAIQKGIGVCVAALWHGNRAFERFLHEKHGTRRFCPLCHDAPPELGEELPF